MVRRAILTTVSHDQGFASSSPELNGTYEDSNTWFEVRVVDGLGQDRVLREPFTRNRCAEEEFCEHVVTWDLRDLKCWFRGKNDVLPDHASGLVPARWLASIHAGDTVSIIPRAQYPAWVNFVVQARIELWVEVVQIMPSSRPRLTENLRSYYDPLNKDSKEIRIVIVEPSETGSSDQPIQLTIRHTQLDDPNHTQYEALSYCWGSDQDTVSVTLLSEDKDWSIQAPVSSNLACALRRIRLPDKTRAVWIDQICINQTDLEERGQQIALMAKIYASATSVPTEIHPYGKLPPGPANSW